MFWRAVLITQSLLTDGSLSRGDGRESPSGSARLSSCDGRIRVSRREGGVGGRLGGKGEHGEGLGEVRM